MDQPKIERVLRLMRLMAGNATFSVDELAETLDTSYRSIYRYIDTFKQCGFAVEKVRGNVYPILEMPPEFIEIGNLVYFSDEEARIVNSLIDGLSETNALKIDLKKKLEAVYDVTALDKYVEKNSYSVNIRTLGHAIREKRKVILRNYRSGNSGTVRDRLVEPFGFTPRYVEVWAWDPESSENKTFRISRIDEVQALDEGWENEERHCTEYLDAFRMHSGKQTHVRLEMTLRAKDLLCEEFPLAEPDITEGEDGRWIFDSMVSRMEGVGRFVIGLAGEVTVVDSPELSGYVDRFVSEHFGQCV